MAKMKQTTPQEWLQSIGIELAIDFVDLSDSKSFSKFKTPSSGTNIVIFSDEWSSRRKQWEGLLLSKAGCYSKRLSARNCEVKELSKLDSKSFLEEFHIQGSNNLGIVYFGLWHKEELVGVMSLGRHSRQISENKIVLDRLCFRTKTQVIGGAGKLLKKAVDWAKKMDYDEIISFSDNRMSIGKVYESIGFTLEKKHKSDYSYLHTILQKRLSKQSQKKSSSKCPDGMTESEWAFSRGLVRIYDYGKNRWVMNLKPEVRMTWKENISKKCASQHASGDFKHSHIRGYFQSEKNNSPIYFSSSYELRCLFLLESNPSVKSFCRCEVFRGEKSWRNPDLYVELNSGTEIWEIKPKLWLKHQTVIDQINDSKDFAAKKGLKFKLWTEDDSQLLSDKDIVSWAKKYLAETQGDKTFQEQSKKNANQKSKRYYHTHIANDKITLFCSFCNKEHTPLRLTHDKNIARNGRYICEREGGHITGSRAKPHLQKNNPHVADGKKECVNCLQILEFKLFSPDNSKSDGLCRSCKICRSKKAKEKYNKKTK